MKKRKNNEIKIFDFFTPYPLLNLCLKVPHWIWIFLALFLFPKDCSRKYFEFANGAFQTKPIED
ncbi:hypothetical protein DERP_011491 [Dermatophagoides pteronyssinus]|uniref:Uncharacterized protein n=1 Tax=Dermatophagoides pteronyssinus TaxID=6956 RepID=A0ABQ8JC17_DERPT|nr:hypothetical protein DERP_011491 [Dermatophagoides pteronyssinus]